MGTKKTYISLEIDAETAARIDALLPSRPIGKRTRASVFRDAVAQLLDEMKSASEQPAKAAIRKRA